MITFYYDALASLPFQNILGSYFFCKVGLSVCVCVWGGGDNEMWWRWCWMENSRNVVLEEERDRNVEVVVKDPQRYRNVVEGLLAMV